MRSDVIAALALSAARVGSGQVKTAVFNPFTMLKGLGTAAKGFGAAHMPTFAGAGTRIGNAAKSVMGSKWLTSPDRAGWAKRMGSQGWVPHGTDPNKMIKMTRAGTPIKGTFGTANFNPDQHRAFSPIKGLGAGAITGTLGMGAANQAGGLAEQAADATGLSDTNNPNSWMGSIGSALGIDSPAERYQNAKRDWQTQRNGMMQQYNQALHGDQDYATAKALREQMQSGAYGGGSSTWNPGGFRMGGWNPFASNNANENMAEMKKSRGVMKGRYDDAVRQGNSGNDEISAATQGYQAELQNPDLDPSEKAHIQQMLQSVQGQRRNTPNGVGSEAHRYWREMQGVGAVPGNQTPPTRGYNTGNYSSGASGVAPPDSPSLMREYRLVNPSEYGTPYSNF